MAKLMADKIQSSGITSVLQEKRVFPPPKAFSQKAQIKSMTQYRKLYGESIRSPEKFWAKQAKAVEKGSGMEDPIREMVPGGTTQCQFQLPG
jgi:hypothetical protein